MLSRTTEYALRAAIFLASAGDENITAQTVAAGTKVPEGYMSKVLNTLARAKIVRSQRGPLGGFSLSIAATDLTMLRVVEAVEPLPRVDSCPLQLGEHASELCPLHSVLASLVDGVAATLATTTIAQLLSTPVVPLGLSGACGFPAQAPNPNPRDQLKAGSQDGPGNPDGPSDQSAAV